MTPRLHTLFVALGSLLTNGAIGIALHIYLGATEVDSGKDESGWDGDRNDAERLLSIIGFGAVRWCSVLAASGAAGVAGVLLNNTRLLRLLSISTLLDLFSSLLLLFLLTLTILSPTLSPLVASLLCTQLTSATSFLRSSSSSSSWFGGELSGAHTVSGSRSSEESGIEILLWGIEACEENFEKALVWIWVLALLGVAVRGWGTFVVGEFRESLKKLKEWEQVSLGVNLDLMDKGGKEVDDEVGSCSGQELGRKISLKRTTTSSASTSSTEMEEMSTTPRRHHYRFKSHTITFPSTSSTYSTSPSSPSSSSSSRRPRLVLVPVFYEPSTQHLSPTALSPDDLITYSPLSPSSPSTTRGRKPPSSTSSSSRRNSISHPSRSRGRAFSNSPPPLLPPSYSSNDYFPPSSSSSSHKGRQRSETAPGALVGGSRENQPFVVRRADEERELGWMA